MKNLKTYRMFESVMELTPEQVQWLNECTNGTWALNPQTGLVDMKGGFKCSQQSLTDFKGVRFGVVDGYFDCHNNALTTLEGAPREVDGDFACYDNQLTSLEGAPREVDGDFACDNNALISLEGAPKTVGGHFNCEDNALISLEGAPQLISGSFVCYDNALISLEGAPKTVGGYFDCQNNALTSLIGAPQLINGNFDCENNKLENLIGSPKRVSGDFWCRRNLLTSLEGAPEYAGRFYSNKNPVSENSLENIYVLMQKGASYIQAVESLWNSLNNEDKSLLYRPEFKWVSEEELKGIKALIAFNKFKFIL